MARFLVTLALLFTLFYAVPALAQQGTWTGAPPEPVNGGPAFGLWLLTDGTVLSHSDALNHWCRLVPGPDGNYADGIWVQLADSPWAMGGATEHVLKDGRFYEAGGEFIYAFPAGSSVNDHDGVQIYDPVANIWTMAARGLYGDIGDSGSAMLSNGDVFGSSRVTTATEIYDPVANVWTAAASKTNGSGDEDAWTSLPNGGVFSVDNTGSCVYNPATNTWTPFTLPTGYSPGDQGPTELMYNGKILCLGFESTAIFTPGPIPSTGSWVLGPAYPGGPTEDAEDEYGCCEPDGLVMFAAYPLNQSPNELVEYDPTTDTFSTINPPPDPVGPYPVSFCDLPNGQVMTCGGSQDWLYTPASAPQDAWRPTVTSVVQNGDGSYTLTGTQLSGLVNGWDEGDDMSGAENYTIVWLKASNGNVYYCKSFNFSDMMPATSGQVQTCQFTVPASVPNGAYNLFVSAVGVQSKTGFSFSLPTTPAAPVLTSLNPNSATAGSQGFTMTVNGTGFVSGATVQWNGANLATSFSSATVITAMVPASDIATVAPVSVTATNPGSPSSNALPFTINPAPTSATITSLSPSSVNFGSPGFTITVTGTGIATGAVVDWNGAALQSMVNSATQITANVPASDLVSVVPVQVTVTNPGANPSNGLPFTIMPHVFTAGLQMFSVPYDYSSYSLATVLGYSSPTLAVWTPASLQYAVTPTPPADALRLGQGYWARIPQANGITFAGTTATTARPFAIPLVKGWNMIGNPFLESVDMDSLTFLDSAGVQHSFAQAVQQDLLGPTLFSFPPGSTNYQAQTSGTIDPYVGYWILAAQNGTLLVPVPVLP